jgi:class 3 adenylate cyclase
MRAALIAHDEVLRSSIEAHGGFLFSHTGDGVVAAFASPNAAVDAAVAAQRALELPVRMGLATGEAELRGADYFGAVLNLAARVMAAGQRLLGGADRLLDARSADTVPSSASRSGSWATDHSAIGLTPAAAHCLDDLALQVRRPAR